MLDEILENYPYDNFVKADGFDEAVIGLDETSMRLIYSVSKCIEILSNDMEIDDAVEYFNFNVCQSHIGEDAPIWCCDDFI